MVLTDGVSVLPLASAHDYKRLGDGDQGPNTGGMGAISPVPLETGLGATLLRTIVHPTVAGLAAEGRPYRGVLYAGVMVTRDGPRLLEYNCRLGDPETQAVLPRLDGDLLPLLRATATGELGSQRAAWKREAAVCVVLAAGGYPGTPQRGEPISGLGDALLQTGVLVFHAGTALKDGSLVTSGGRVLSVVGRGATVAEAAAVTYDAVGKVRFEGMQFRRDIGGGLA
jgi:phosphoribosylamine--glycine ligase